MDDWFSLGSRVARKVRGVRRRMAYPYSQASDRLRAIFVHVPKNAGSSVRAAMGEPPTGRRHLPWWVYKDANLQKFNSYFKFAFTRDPVSRAISGYSYLKRGGNQNDDLDVAEFLKKFEDFNEFAFECLSGANMMMFHPIFRPQCLYLTDWKGDLQVDFLGSFESIDEDFDFVAEKLGISSALPKKNTGNKPSVSEVNISSQTLSILRETYRCDFDLINKNVTAVG